MKMLENAVMMRKRQTTTLGSKSPTLFEQSLEPPTTCCGAWYLTNGQAVDVQKKKLILLVVLS